MAYYKCNGYDTSSVTAGAGDVRAGKSIVSSGGAIIAGSVPERGGVTTVLPRSRSA